MDRSNGSSHGSATKRGRRSPERTDLDAGELADLVHQFRLSGDRRARNRIVEAHLHLVDHYVSTYGRRSGNVSADDLRQTALLALIGAVERFDPGGGASLSTFATRTIDGELKRYLRDRTWLVRPPRAAQETHLDIRAASEDLSHRLGRSPSVSELATRLGLPRERVLAGLVAGQARNNESFDRPMRGDGSVTTLEAAMGEPDGGYDLTEARISLRDGIARLDDRQRKILELRFGQELTQLEIARRMGVSQSYVSRIIQSALSVLRAELG